jgi:hypothetical protein
VVFREVAEAVGLRFTHFHGRRSTPLPEDMGSGLAWGDYDNDGRLDLFAINGSTFQDEQDPALLLPIARHARDQRGRRAEGRGRTRAMKRAPRVACCGLAAAGAA